MNDLFFKHIIRNFFMKGIKYKKYFVVEYCANASLGNVKNKTFDQTVPSKQDEEFKFRRKIVQNKLVEMLDIKPIKALELVTSHKRFCDTPFSLISENFLLCTTNKLSTNIVLKYPHVLTDGDLSKKLEKLKMLDVKLSISIPLVKLELYRLTSVSLRKNETTTRIKDLCRIFNINPREVCEILSTKPFFLSINMKHLEDHLKLLIETGISKEDILKDLWIFKYSNLFITDRLQCIKEHKVEQIKTWMLHCPEETLYKHIKRESDNRDILGENSVAEYLSERLKCSEEIAKHLIKKQPALQTKSLTKMNEMIDFLYDQGFTPSQICKVPKILLHSSKTAKNRLKELAALGKKPDSLYILTKSQKQYMQHIETLTKAKTKAKTM